MESKRPDPGPLPSVSAPSSGAKRPYHKPKVEEFGSVLELTAGAGLNAGDTIALLSVTAC